MDIYSELGVRRVVNAIGPWTRIGGSTMPKEVLDAIVAANSSYVELWELEEKAGKIVADLTGAEAAFITSGCFSALALSVAACMAGKDPDQIKRLPDTSMLARNEIIQQTCQKYKYDRAVTITGAKLVPVGEDSHCTAGQIEANICPKTAAILFLAPGESGAVPIEKVIRIGKLHGIPVIVDAPGNIYGSEMWVPEGVYPDEGYKNYVKLGADLVCCGGKFVGAPQSTGYVVGRKDLIETIALHSFVGYENPSNLYRPIGRVSKMDRQLIVALVEALRRWKRIDHRLRLQHAYEKKEFLAESMASLPGVKMNDVPVSAIMAGLEVILEKMDGTETARIVEELLEGDPRIEVFYSREGMVRGLVRSTPNSFVVNVMYMQDGDEMIFADRFRSLVSARSVDVLARPTRR